MDSDYPKLKSISAVNNPSLPGFLSAFYQFLFPQVSNEFVRNLFQVYLQRLARRRIEILLIFIVILEILAWPVDFLVLPDNTTILYFALYRIMTVTLLLSGIVAVEFSESLKRWVNFFFIALCMFQLCLAGLLFGDIRGLNYPWFYSAYIIPFQTVVFGLSFIKRLVATAAVTLSFSTSYLLMQNVPFSYQYRHHAFSLIVVTILLGTLMGHLIYSLDLHNFLSRRRLKRREMENERLANRDQLTGLYNRRKFENQLQEKCISSSPEEPVGALMMADIDNFKEINDSYGHKAGDAVLEYFGEILESETRSSDVPGRYGGDEFSILLPNAEIDAAMELAKQLKDRLEDKTFSTSRGTFTIHCSMGVTELDKNLNPKDAVRKADRALYEAKRMEKGTIVKATNIPRT